MLSLTLNPDSLNVNANCVATVDFPTPPFPDNISIICLTLSNILVVIYFVLFCHYLTKFYFDFNLDQKTNVNTWK